MGMNEQTSQAISRSDILRFLDYLADKGLAKRATVQSRKAAVNTLLSILSDEEAADLRGLDIDGLIGRFHNIKGDDFKPASLRVYKSRLQNVIHDYGRYKQSPLNYRPLQGGERPSKPRQETARSAVSDKSASQVLSAVPEAEKFAISGGVEAVETIVFPIPLRRGVIVRVSGIPSDLTPEEAEKIGNVVLALSGSQEPK